MGAGHTGSVGLATYLLAIRDDGCPVVLLCITNSAALVLHFFPELRQAGGGARLNTRLGNLPLLKPRTSMIWECCSAPIRRRSSLASYSFMVAAMCFCRGGGTSSRAASARGGGAATRTLNWRNFFLVTLSSFSSARASSWWLWATSLASSYEQQERMCHQSTVYTLTIRMRRADVPVLSSRSQPPLRGHRDQTVCGGGDTQADDGDGLRPPPVPWPICVPLATLRSRTVARGSPQPNHT